MPLDDDDDDKWIYKPHTAAKHEVYQKYLFPWINKLTTANENYGHLNKIRLVDCFAGRGSYVDTQNTEPVNLEHLTTPAQYPGSPQLILDRATDRSDQFEIAECIFIEKNGTNYDILTDTLQETSGVAENIEVTKRNGAWQDVILDILEETGGDQFPTLFFIDPFGFQSLDYDVITEISSRDRHEFLITFMQRDINRFFEVEDHQSAIESVFGNSKFQEEVSKYETENWEDLVEYYTDKLEETGPKHTFEYMITEPNSKQTIYYLVFGTNSKHGLHVMREVMAGCGTGGFAYAPRHPDPDFDRSQQTLGVGLEDTKNHLTNRFAGYRIEFGDMVETCTEEQKYGSDTESDYRDAIRELEQEGEVEVVRLESAKNGIQRGDLIDFPD
jgi:three-Cys-motif partner protein